MPIEFTRGKYVNGPANCCGATVYKSNGSRWKGRSYANRSKGISIIGDAVETPHKTEEYTLDHVETKQGTLSVLVLNA